MCNNNSGHNNNNNSNYNCNKCIICTFILFNDSVAL